MNLFSCGREPVRMTFLVSYWSTAGHLSFLIGWWLSTGPWQPALLSRSQSPSDVLSSELPCFIWIAGIYYFHFFLYFSSASAKRDSFPESRKRTWWDFCLFRNPLSPSLLTALTVQLFSIVRIFRARAAKRSVYVGKAVLYREDRLCSRSESRAASFCRYSWSTPIL